MGRGGFGVVYLAHDDKLDRTVALKVQRPEAIISSRLRQRFLHEAKAAARLRHPHIAGVYEVGKAAMQIWISTEYCDGDSLAVWLTTRPVVAPRSAAAFMACLADALGYSHQEGVFHRDIKPSNILLHKVRAGDSNGPAALADYVPKLIDFGLAKILDSEPSETKEGALVGTPAYMAPEQASGQRTQIGPATDVYALGAVLYEILVGEPPFRGNNSADTLRKVVADEPTNPRHLRPDVPPDLAAICLKCLQKSTLKRYATPEDLAADLRRFLAGRPTVARSLTPIQRLEHWSRRQPAQAVLAAAIAMGAILFVAGYFREVELRRDVQNQRDAKDHALEGQRLATQMAESHARRASQEAEAANKTAEFMTKIFQTSDLIGFTDLGFRRADERLKPLTLDDVLRRGSAEVEAELQKDPQVQARLMNALGNINRSLGHYAAAESLLRKSLAIRLSAAANSPEEACARDLLVAESQFHLAWLLHDLGSYDEAEPLYRSALATVATAHGKDSLEAAKTQFNLAWLLTDRGETQQAEELFREVIRIRRRLLPSKDREILAAEIGLTSALYAQGRESEALNEAASTLPGDKLVKLLAGYQLARQQRRLRQFEPATASYQRLLVIAQNELPAQHPLRAALLIDMAGLLKEKGDLPAAEDAVREGLQIVRAVMGRHPRLIEGMTTFAGELESRGDFAEAEQLNHNALEISWHRRPTMMHEKVDILRSLARIQSSQGNFGEAKALVEESLQLKPVDANYRIEGTYQLAVLKQATGNWREAEAIYRQLLSDSPAMDPLELNLSRSECLLEEGDYQAASNLRNEVLTSIRAALNQPGPDLTAIQLVYYAKQLARLGKSKEAANLLEKALEIERKQQPPDHPNLGQRLESIARMSLRSLDAGVNADQRRQTLDAVETMHREAEGIYRRRLGEGHAWLAQNALLKAQLLGARGDWQAAETTAEAAITIFATSLPAEHPWLLEARHQRATILRELKEHAAAEKDLSELLDVRQKHLPELHADILETQLDLAKTLLQRGNIAAAKAELQEMLDQLAERLPHGGQRVARIEALLGVSLAAEQDYESAERRLLSSHAALSSMYGDSDAETREVAQSILSLYQSWNKPDKGAEFQQLIELRPAS